MKKAQAFSTTSEITLSWLIRMRWLAVAGQAAIIWVSSAYLHVALPLSPLLTLIAVTVLSNVTLQVFRAHLAEKAAFLLVALLTLDTLLLTGLLYFSGGPINPFSVLYLVHVALASVTLPRPWSWGVAFLSIAGFGFLFVSHVAVSETHHDFSVHLRGMWVAFALAAILIAYLAGGLFMELQNRDAQLASLRAETNKRDRLISVATLAAGAAHELNTPLATIALAAKELEATWSSAPADVREDLQLICSQIERCRLIVEQMGSYGEEEQAPEARSPTQISAFVQQILAFLSEAEQRRIHVDLANVRSPVCLPVQSVQRVLLNLLKNALDATAPSEKVVLRTQQTSNGLVFQVEDFGEGMSSEVLTHAFEPFYTTKEPGKGMGLGLFISRFLSEKMGAHLDLVSAPHQGTRATLSFSSEAST